MTDRPDPDDRDVVRPYRCSECDFLILDEVPYLGKYGWVHVRCLAAVTA